MLRRARPKRRSGRTKINHEGTMKTFKSARAQVARQEPICLRSPEVA
jgi:hypothetical protein